MLNTSLASLLQDQLHGRVLTPGDDGYEEARSLFNGMIEHRPAMIAQCSGTADVIACVNFARENNVPIAAKGGGHGVAGRALVDDGLVVDLSPMRSVVVDPQLKTTQVQGGATLADLDRETQAFGLATPAGVDSRTGVAGLALGGGIGHLARRFGLTIDNLQAADIVTADGKLLHVCESEHEDLFWALRGGGGNFGIVTSFDFRLHEVGPEVIVAQAFHLFDDAPEVLRFYRSFISDIPNEVGCFCLVIRVPPMEPFPTEHHGKIALALIANHSGDHEEGRRVLEPIESFGNPILSVITPMPYTQLQSNFDAGFPKGARYYWKSHYLRELSDAAIDTVIRQVGDLPGEFTGLGFEPMGGAISQVDPTATAFPHRNATCGFAVFAGWQDVSRDDEVISWTRAFHEAMEPFSTGGTYVNYIQGDAGDEFKQAYGANFERLREVKQRYDPQGQFNAHQRIRAS